MMEHDVLRALGKPGCPICNVVRDSINNYLKWFVIENYHEAQSLIMLAEGGFCRYHVEQVAHAAKSRLSVTYDFINRSLLRKIEELVTSLDQEEKDVNTFLPFKFKALRNVRLRKRFAVLKRQQPCPVCKVIASSEDYAINILARLLADPANSKLYQMSAGLCRDHLVKALSPDNPQISKLLLKDFARRLKELSDDFQEYFRKMDYRFASEPKGDEQNAWQRAVKLINGENYE